MRIGLLSAMFLVFLVLKLVGVIDCSWFLVFSPLIAGFALWLFVVGIVFLLAVISS